jgi:transcription initiation factor TFIIIB Brf1 subunit/transcription initiation factor TFIIB
LNCNNCNGEIVYPEGLNGEKICNHCGLVITEAPVAKNFVEWTPDWYSNWNEQDSETLKEWLTTLRAVSCQLSLPNYPFREEAARTIRKQNRTLFKSQKLSKNKRATVAALMHLILKEYGKSRPIKDISKDLRLDYKTVMKQSWLLNSTFTSKKETIIRPRKTSLQYLHEYAGKITRDKELIINAENTLQKIKGSGGNPIGVAAGAFYFICKKKTNISKEKIGETFGISERTVYANEVKIRRLLVSRERKSPTELIALRKN